jgi:hypothetical protein
MLGLFSVLTAVPTRGPAIRCADRSPGALAGSAAAIALEAEVMA